MLTEEERREIEEAAKESGHWKAASVDALKVVQKRRGWVCDEALEEVAGLLDMTPAELDGVATFYNLIYRRPVGRHVILLCDSVACWIMGYETLLEHLERRLGIGPGETTADGAFTLLPVACLGACDHAPAMMVDEDLHGDLTPEKVDRILQSYGDGKS
jgi:NADH-quinone oxidoreductase subunit E